ncbi:MAG TPA: HD domain-containing phosphohydrolase [Steroidobacteraceae bacterium]|nr:HD domain-containing phosphohydrolase [Steroidobacteraceae bacterium]
MAQKELPRVMCVDDEPRVLEGLALHLRRDYEVHTATSGAVALKSLIDMGAAPAVVISDMRMPVMDGATFLKQVMHLYPETTRILLTGEPGREAAVDAINKGQIFRFLTKPCAPDQLRAAVDAAVTQHRVLIAEKVLLQETLIGCIKALIDVLAITNPVAFGRASRVTRLANDLANVLGGKRFWQVEAAAMLSQIGYISLPVELVEKVYYGEQLTPEEKVLMEGVPQVARTLLGHIPRLEPVLQILTEAIQPGSGVAGDGMIKLGAGILSLVLEYDALIAQGHSASVAIQTLRSSKSHDQQMVEQFASMLGTGSAAEEIRTMPLRLVKPGMVILDDLRTHMGTLLVPKGFEVTEAFLERMRNFGSSILQENVRVMASINQ